MLRKINLLFFLLFAISVVGHADDNVTDFHQNKYQEMVYIHTDKAYYVAGEFVKFKVYCLEQQTSTPSKLSRVAYVEILDKDNTPHLQSRIALEHGSGHGELYIPATIPSGHFIIRGYTRWMRNFGPKSYFHGMVTIINQYKQPGLSPKPLAVNSTIQFFPEGGNLVQGVASKVVFVAKDEYGKSMDFKGILMANDTLEVMRFAPMYHGLGHFIFTPDADAKYHVELEQQDGGVVKHPFIPIAEFGSIMQVDLEKSVVRINSAADELVSIVVHHKGDVLNQQDVELRSGMNVVPIDLSKFDKGIAKIEIYNHGNLMLSRAVFKRGMDEGISLSLPNKSYSTREKVSIDITKLLEDTDLEKAEFSISVANESSQLSSHFMDFRHFLLLQNELNSIYNIEDYFDAPSGNAELLINDLLIAYATPHQKSSTDKYIAEYRSPLVTGKLVDKQGNTPPSYIGAYISVPGKHLKFYATRSGKNGELIFETPNLYGKHELVAMVDYSQDSTFTIELDNPYAEDYLDVELPVFDIDESVATWIIGQSQNIQVQNANLKFDPEQQFSLEIDTLAFYKTPSASYLLDDYTRFVVMEEVMREYVAGVYVRKNKDGFYFRVLDSDRNLIMEGSPLMLIDGVPFFDADDIMDVDPLKVERIETVTSKFAKGALDWHGIVSYTTYSGNLDGFQLQPDAIVQDYDGVQMPKKYTFPDYDAENERRSPKPDFRNTLYWNPQFMSDGDITNPIQFFTSDDVGNYTISINGLDGKGNAISVKGRIQVAPKVN